MYLIRLSKLQTRFFLSTTVKLSLCLFNRKSWVTSRVWTCLTVKWQTWTTTERVCSSCCPSLPTWMAMTLRTGKRLTPREKSTERASMMMKTKVRRRYGGFMMASSSPWCNKSLSYTTAEFWEYTITSWPLGSNLIMVNLNISLSLFLL